MQEMNHGSTISAHLAHSGWCGLHADASNQLEAPNQDLRMRRQGGERRSQRKGKGKEKGTGKEKRALPRSDSCSYHGEQTD